MAPVNCRLRPYEGNVGVARGRVPQVVEDAETEQHRACPSVLASSGLCVLALGTQQREILLVSINGATGFASKRLMRLSV